MSAVDAGLMRRAERICVSASASQMPVLMDAVLMRAEATLAVVEPQYRQWVQLDRAASGGEVGEAVEDFAAKVGVSTHDLIENFRARYAADPDGMDADLATWSAMTLFHMLARTAVLDRHAVFCGEEVSALVEAGAVEGLLESSLAENELPSPCGIAYLHRPEGAKVLLWSAGNGVVTAALRTPEDLGRWLVTDPAPEKGVAATRVPATGFDQAVLSPVGSDEPVLLSKDLVSVRVRDEERRGQALKYLLSLSHMIAQERLVQSESIATTTRSPQRRKKRARTRREEITYLTYRPRVRSGESGGSREYIHRWVVRGHWRRQWYPSIERHKPIWISDYIAGPEGQPIVLRDKVSRPSARGLPVD